MVFRAVKCKSLENCGVSTFPVQLTGSYHACQDWNNNTTEYQLSGRMETVLSTAAPLQLVVPDGMPIQKLSIALRFAHDLNKYHKLDSEIIQSSEAMQRAQRGHLSSGNIIVIGDPQSPFSQWCFTQQGSAFDVSITPPQLNGRPLDDPSQGMLDIRTHCYIHLLRPRRNHVLTPASYIS